MTPKPHTGGRNGGRPPKPPGTKARSISVTLPADILTWVEQQAQADGLKPPAWIAGLVKKQKETP